MSSARPLSQRQLGAPLATHPSQSNQKRKRQCLSTGRGMPLPPQSAVVVKAFFLKQEYDIRRKSARLSEYSTLSGGSSTNLLAPLPSTRDPLRAMQGELAYYRLDAEPLVPANYMANPTTDLTAIVDVGGLPEGTRLGFAGWVAQAPDSSHDNSDYVGTLQTAGTCTVVNTGPDIIPVMSTVYFDERPYVLYNGNTPIPGVKEVGQPADVGNAKFRPALYALSHRDVFTWLRIAKNAVDTILSNTTAFPVYDTEQTKSFADTAVGNCAKSLPSTFPLRRYIIFTYYQKALVSIILKNSSADDLQTLLRGFRSLIVKPIADERKSEIKAMGQTESSFGKLFKYIDDESFDIATDTVNRLRFFEELNDLKEMIVCDIHGWLKEHAIGTALNTSESGAPLDINLGFFY